MKILGIHLNHDANICLYNSENQYFQYAKSERISDHKHNKLTWPFVDILSKNNFDPDCVVICFGDVFDNQEVKNLYGHYENISKFNEELDKIIEEKYDIIIGLNTDGNTRPPRKAGDVIKSWVDAYNIFLQKTGLTEKPIYWIQHDYAHILSGWCCDKNYKDFAYGVAIDGGGPDWNNKLIVEKPFDLEKCKILHSDKTFRGKEIYLNSMGSLMKNIGDAMNLKGSPLDFAGKIMGLQSYGHVNFTEIIKFIKTYQSDITKLEIIRYYRELISHVPPPFSFENKKFLNFVATIHRIWQETALLIFEKFIVDKNSKVLYTGGCAQNTVTNTALLDNYPNLNVIPHCYDGGLSLGCIALALLKNQIDLPTIDDFPYIQTDVKVEDPSKETIQKVAELLSQGKIVGWYQGHGEIGPRALGNRSILINPSIKNAKDILNTRVKHREHWRPFAPSILEEHAEEWFDIPKSKYMMFACRIKPNKKHLVPSVVHKDLTSRIQTVSKTDNIFYRKLIQEFFSLTGIPLLLNTSLNDGGGPIVGNPQQAIDFFKKTGMDALCVGDTIYEK